MRKSVWRMRLDNRKLEDNNSFSTCGETFNIIPFFTFHPLLAVCSTFYGLYNMIVRKYILFAVSHTTDDMIFQWDPDVPLVVDENIELPQLALVKNYTADCTQVYSTGKMNSIYTIHHFHSFSR